jgi:ATP-dependent helicase/nuclease subunit A
MESPMNRAGRLRILDSGRDYLKANLSNSKSRQLKPDQAAAAHTLDRHVSVTAGPGAGKTTVLVERYLGILRTQKVSTDQIVAITFTNRAANEMRQRVRTKIDHLLRQTDGDERRKWVRHKRTLEGAVITTIHSFCSRLLHEFPVEAQIDPQFILLDEHQAVMLLEAVVEESVTETIHDGDEKVIELAQAVGRPRLVAALAELYRTIHDQGLSLTAIAEQTAASHAGEADYAAGLKELDGRMNELIAAARLTPTAERKRREIAARWPQVRALLEHPPETGTSLSGYCRAVEDLYGSRPSSASSIKTLVKSIDELLWGEKPPPDDRLRGKVVSCCFDLYAKRYALSLLEILDRIDQRLDEEKRRLSVLDFSDLQLRTIKLLREHPEALLRLSDRFKFFLVDEFQDTNTLQRDLMMKLAFAHRANLFIVGDRKQSIYGFRGADVDVFQEMTAMIEAEGGLHQPLPLNFRSQKSLIDSCNFLFERIFAPRAAIASDQLPQLGYVGHEPSAAERENRDEPPLVELLISVLPDGAGKRKDRSEDGEQDESAPQGVRERDAEQVVERISSLVDISGTKSDLCGDDESASHFPRFKYGDIALLFRALTGVWAYEGALRRAGIPYLTVQGKGFYQREEITDLIQLLRFLDNTSDELALAAVLRSPLCGLSDNALLALRCAPWVNDPDEPERWRSRKLLRALHHHREIAFIDEAERGEIERAVALLDLLIQRRNRYGIAELLRFAVASSEFMTVIAANFDGAQRIANVEKLFRLAEQFERSDAHLIRDFVRFVEQFEAVGGRESEGQMDESANVVRLMTIHQAKGLEFPVVIIPDLQREAKPRDSWYILDRHKGLTVRVPDGRGQTVRGALLNELRQRVRWREEFESMRLLYVAATRAKDRLIFSGTIARKDLANLSKTNQEQWLAWIWQALRLDEFAGTGVLEFGDGVQFGLSIERDPSVRRELAPTANLTETAESPEAPETSLDPDRPFTELFPLLQPVLPERGRALRRFSVTQLLNFQRCARQYYFDRMLRAPSTEELAGWNDADAPEPPANLTATLKGAVIHRFCETFRAGDEVEARLLASFEAVVRQRQTELADRVFDIETEKAVRDLMPLAQNYLASDVFGRVQGAETGGMTVNSQSPSAPGVWSELRFRLRRPLGILTGTIDKLLITPSPADDGVDVEIVDFKTNRFRSRPEDREDQMQLVAVAPAGKPISEAPLAAAGHIEHAPAQGQFDFDPPVVEIVSPAPQVSLEREIDAVARDYQLQMQSYALALRELLSVSTANGSDRVNQSPGTERGLKINSLRATLHFIDPNIEISLPPGLLEIDTSARAIDDAILAIASLDGTLDAERFPTTPATHCRMCNFLNLCPAGRLWSGQH